MADVRNIIRALERWAPPELAETWDTTGLIIEPANDQITGIAVTLDVTPAVVEAAAKSALSLIVSHHPPVFSPLKSITSSSPAGTVVLRAVRAGMGVYSLHTNLDKVRGGVSDSLATELGLVNTGFLAPSSGDTVKFVTFVPPGHLETVRTAAADAGAGTIGDYRECSFGVPGTGTFIPGETTMPFTGKTGTLTRVDEVRLEMTVPSHLAATVVQAARAVHPYEEMAYDLIPASGSTGSTGYGIVGDLGDPMTRDAFLAHVCTTLGIGAVTASHGGPPVIRRVAVMGGRGDSFITAARAAGVDAFVTGDIGHHPFCDHGTALLLVDATHRATELPVLAPLAARLREYAGDVPIMIMPGDPPTHVFVPHA